ncbi:FAD binding domain protein [Aspergillus heteromorphus CBS 117.55]|uniref:FAD binding domain protein n=1 Tax=Aspergillus heteromorphus CBS 117.55 TaxID=1448321 RepID=A0A317WQV3_9EURO|nr:FAD binding domain protein [Aspergillus heteromorphus CBS 117.55]PWY87497.1 FAD binding domain protein [Aspergillus heteromorphus CBS 117.55]
MTQLETHSLKIAIIGSGLAGCLAARILREQHTVTIYEREATRIETAAAINLGPNAVQILDGVGFDRGRACSIPVTRSLSYNKRGEKTGESVVDYKKEYGADWLFHHRADLRDELLRLATAPSEELGLKGRPAEVVYGARVVGGMLKRGPAGTSAFRFTMTREKVVEILGGVPEVLDSSKPACMTGVYALDPTERRVVIYPCRNYQILNFAIIVPDSMLKSTPTDSWSAPGDRDELVSLFTDFPDWVLAYFRAAENIKLWQLREQDPLPTYIRGRTVLVGDAAHAMTPHQGQGGSQAIEDAEGFRLLLGEHVTRHNVSSILEDFDRVRRPRASQIQRNTSEATGRYSAKEVWRFRRLNWTYPGILEGLEE